jgi:hypothetical protein
MVKEHSRTFLAGNKNVHVIPIAFEVDRAVLPLKEVDRVDKVYILSGAEEGLKTDAYAGKVIKKLRGIAEVELVHYGYYDYPSVFAAFVKIGRKEAGNNVFVNLSSGGRIQAIAGTLAASMFGWTIYYAEPERYNIDMGQSPEGSSSGIKHIFEIKTYPIEKPKDSLVKCLAMMHGIETQKTLMAKLEAEGMLEDDLPGESFAKKSYNKFRRDYLNPLLEKKWISRDGTGKRGRLEITKAGEEIVRIFGRT